jgi:hypothetical protein
MHIVSFVSSEPSTRDYPFLWLVYSLVERLPVAEHGRAAARIQAALHGGLRPSWLRQKHIRKAAGWEDRSLFAGYRCGHTAAGLPSYEGERP